MTAQTLTSLLQFALTSLLIELTPGPNMMYLALVAAQSGRRAGYAAVAGVALGLAVVGVAAALGLSAVLTASPASFALLRWGGIAYLLYLAWDAWRDGTRPIDEPSKLQTRFFGRGLVTNLLNPKAMVFYVAVLPTFIDQAGRLLEQSLVLTAVYVSVATGVHGGIVALAGSLHTRLISDKMRKILGAVFAVALVAVAAWLAWSTR